MISLPLIAQGRPLTVLCLGAHADDIEIGAGATLLTWLASGAMLSVHWCVLSATGARAEEARASATELLAGAAQINIELCGFRDGHFPYEGARIKDWFEGLKARVDPDVILTSRGEDAHQDHREVARLTANTFRDHLVLAYEIPKWDGDLGRPNVYVPVTAAVLERKVALLIKHFASQRSKDWFDADTFRGLARLRGMECRAEERFAEAFHATKIRIG